MGKTHSIPLSGTTWQENGMGTACYVRFGLQLLRENAAHGVSHTLEIKKNELNIHTLTGELVNNKNTCFIIRIQ